MLTVYVYLNVSINMQHIPTWIYNIYIKTVKVCMYLMLNFYATCVYRILHPPIIFLLLQAKESWQNRTCG